MKPLISNLRIAVAALAAITVFSAPASYGAMSTKPKADPCGSSALRAARDEGIKQGRSLQRWKDPIDHEGFEDIPKSPMIKDALRGCSEYNNPKGQESGEYACCWNAFIPAFDKAMADFEQLPEDLRSNEQKMAIKEAELQGKTYCGGVGCPYFVNEKTVGGLTGLFSAELKRKAKSCPVKKDVAENGPQATDKADTKIDTVGGGVNGTNPGAGRGLASTVSTNQ